MPNRSLLALPLVLAALVGTAADLPAFGQTQPRAATYENPVIGTNFPDPHIIRVGNVYYAYATNTDNVNLPVQRSSDLVNWTAVGEGFPVLPQWVEPGNTWAPEVAAVGSRFALYYTARDRGSTRQCIGVAVASKPEGPFTDSRDKPLVCQVEDGGSIDASPFTDKDGKRYLYWKNDGNCCGFRTNIYVQRLSSDGTQLRGQVKILIANTELWEGNLVEAPFVYRRPETGKYYLFYSSGPWNSDFYAVGAAVGFSPMGPFSKLNAYNPVLKSAGEVAGPGHNGVINDARGRPWFYYHAWDKDFVTYEAGGRRAMLIDPLEFRNGVPIIRPTTTSRPAPAPVGAR